MGTLRISYWGTVDKHVAGDPVKTEAVTTSEVSAQSAVIPPNAVVATITGDAAHIVTIGSNPTAADGVGSFYLPASVERDIRLTRHGFANYKIAAITA